MMKQLARALAARMGGVLLSRREYDVLCQTRATAIAALTAHEATSLEPGVTGIVFSKDRALQIYTLLFSYFALVKNPAPLVVIYNASTPEHAQAYAEVAKAFAGAPVKIRWVRETERFATLLPGMLSEVTTRNVFFLVDDIVFIRPVDLALAVEIDPMRFVLSLRLAPHLKRSYTAQVDQSPPAFAPAAELVAYGADLLSFRWFEQGNEWSYPYSVDGHVFATAEIRVLSRLAGFKAPNTYEAALMEFKDLCRERVGVCYRESKLLNLPLNRVQDEVANIAGQITPDFLLEQFNQGMMLDIAPLRTYVPSAPHEEVAVGFVKRPG
jgi:hypothetical protein